LQTSTSAHKRLLQQQATTSSFSLFYSLTPLTFDRFMYNKTDKHKCSQALLQQQVNDFIARKLFPDIFDAK
jgi:hypothetical protein